MQMLAHYTMKSYAPFKTAFDADAEDRANNSLNLMQLWRESDTSAWALYDVGNPRAAKDYLDGAAGVFNSQGGVTATSFHFVETA